MNASATSAFAKATADEHKKEQKPKRPPSDNPSLPLGASEGGAPGVACTPGPRFKPRTWDTQVHCGD